VLVAAAGAGWAMAVDAATFAVSAACLWRLRAPRRAAPATSSFATDLREGWTAFRARRWVWTFVVYFAIGNMLWGAWSALGPVVADRDLGGPAVWGTVLAAVGAGALAGSLLATGARPARPLVHIALMDALFILPLAFLAAAAPAPVLACAAFLSGAGMMLGMSVWESTFQRRVPAESLSRVASYDWFGSLAFRPLGLALWGPLAGAIGISTALWLAFGLFAAATASMLALPDTRSLRA
jgi:Transmembrane secretion effector